MKHARRLTTVLIALQLFNFCWAQTVSPTQPTRWVSADDVRVRAQPSLDGQVVGALPRGAELILKTPDDINGFCLIEGEGKYGYMSCKFLSSVSVPRSRAGEGGVPPDQRWVSGNGVTLREAPRLDSPVVARLSLNRIVKLIEKDAGGGYCKVQPADGLGGFTACTYLVSTPVVLSNVAGYGSSSAGYDPERAFALNPSWGALEGYANFLKTRNAEKVAQGVRPSDAALDRMKDHLALGIMGSKPTRYADWAELKRKAETVNLESVQEANLLKLQNNKTTRELDLQAQRASSVNGELQSEIGIFSWMDQIIPQRNAEAAIRLVRKLEFPIVAVSFFKSESDLAPPNTSAENASGRFGIVFRQLVTPRPKPGPIGRSS